MSEELVEELRDYNSSMPTAEKYDLVGRAADTIESLRQRNAELEKAVDTWMYVLDPLQRRNALLLLDSHMLAAALEERDELLERVSELEAELQVANQFADDRQRHIEELEEGLNVIAEWHITETRNDYQAIARRLLKDTR